MLSLQSWVYYLDISRKYKNDTDKKKIILFVFLWMRYNEYYSDNFGNVRGDKRKALKISENQSIAEKYERFKNNFTSSFAQIPFEDGTFGRQTLKWGRPLNELEYNQTHNALKDFLEVVYQIRCNFFHGDKQPIQTDIKLIGWAYDCLNELLQYEGIID